MAEVLKTDAERALEDRYQPQANSTESGDAVLQELGLMDDETGIPLIEAPEEEPAPAPEAEGDESLAKTALKKTGEIAGGAVVDTTQELGNFAIDVGNAMDNWMQERGYTNQDFIQDDFQLNYADRLIPQSEDTASRVARKVGGYLIPFTGAFKALKGAKALGTVSKGVIAGAATGFAAMDPDEKNLSNLVQEESDLLAPVAGLMAIDEDDSKLQARFKNSMESLVVDGVFLGTGKLGGIAFNQFKAAKKARSLTKKGEQVAETVKVVEAEGTEVTLKAPRVSSKDVIPGSDVNLLTITDSPDLLKLIKETAKSDLPSIQAARKLGFVVAPPKPLTPIQKAKIIEPPAFALSKKNKSMTPDQQRYIQNLVDRFPVGEEIEFAKVVHKAKSGEEFVIVGKGTREAEQETLKRTPSISFSTTVYKRDPKAPGQLGKVVGSGGARNHTRGGDHAEDIFTGNNALNVDKAFQRKGIASAMYDVIESTGARMAPGAANKEGSAFWSARAKERGRNVSIFAKPGDLPKDTKGLNIFKADDLNDKFVTRMDEVRANAEAIKNNPERAEQVLKAGEERLLNAEETIAANQLFENSLKEAKLIVDQALKSGKSVDEVAARESLETVRRLQRIVFGNKAEQGRALAAQKAALESRAAAKKSEYVANVIDFNGGKQGLKEDLVAFSQAMDVPESQIIGRGSELMEKSMGRKMFDAAFEVRINGLVSSPKTIAVAVVNGMFRAPLEIAERGIASIFSRKAPAGERVFFSEAVEQTRALFDESATQFYALMGGLFDGTKMAAQSTRIQQALQKQKSLPQFLDILQANKINKTISAENFGIEGFMGKAVDSIGSVISAPTSLLQRADRAIGAVHYRMEARALAAREAAARGLSGKEAAELIETLASSPPNSLRPQFKELANQLQDQAVSQANKARFLSPLEGAFKSAENALHAPGLRIFVPFARIDLNILSQSMERIPGLAKFAPGYRQAMAQGGPAAAQAQARVALGGTFMMGVGAMAMQGRITGDGPKDFNQRKLLESQGWQSNSIRIGDEYIRYDRFAEPIARAMKLSANITDIAGFMYGEMQDENVSTNAKDLMAVTAAVIADTASPEFLTGGLGDLMLLIDNPERGTDAVLRQVVAGQVPFSSLLRTVRQEIDPAKRTTKSLDESVLGTLEQQWNEIANLIPGYSDNLPPQRNMFGDVVQYPAGFGPDMISPIYSTEFKPDKVTEEMVKLGNAGPLMHPKPKPGEEHLTVRMPANTIEASAGGVSNPVRMSPQQYDRYIQLSAGVDLKQQPFPGLTLKQALGAEIENDYPSLNGMDVKTDQAKRVIIAKIVEAYRASAKAQLVMEEPEIQTQMQENFNNIQRAFTGDEL